MMKLIDVKQGTAHPAEGVGYPVDVADLAAAKVAMVVYPESGAPWIEREPFAGREHDADLLAVADALMAEAEAIHTAPPPPPTLDEAKAAALREINAAYETEMATILADYPQAETLTWDKQEAEARAWRADITAPTPCIDAIAEARDMDKVELVSRIIAKADAWIAASGAATGKRQRIEDAIAAAATVAEVEAIAW